MVDFDVVTGLSIAVPARTPESPSPAAEPPAAPGPEPARGPAGRTHVPAPLPEHGR